MDDEHTLRLMGETEPSARLAQDLFQCVRQELLGILPPGVQVEHVGATAVPGCLTKGDLDIVVRVGGDVFETCAAALDARFDVNPGSIRTPEFAAFVDRSAGSPVGIQLVVVGSELDVFTQFRDALCASPELVSCYNTLKRGWDGRDMEGYRKAKARFIAWVLTGATA